MLRRKSRSPKVSVLVTAKDPQELKAKVLELKRQDHPNFEVVATLGGTIAQGYNRAIRRAKGEILVFTETDVAPLSRSWLRRLAAHVRDGEVVKGLEIFPQGFNFSNTACPAAIAKRFPLDESYAVAEDTAWSEQLVRHGIKIRMITAAGVLHLRRPGSAKALRRAYRYGRSWVRIRRRYGFEAFNSLVKQTKHQIAAGKAALRGVADELRAGSGISRRSPRARRRRAS